MIPTLNPESSVAPSSSPAARKIWLLRIAILLLVAAVALVLFAFGGPLKQAVARILVLLRDAGPWAFFFAMALLPAFGFPLLPFALAAGPAFGPVLGPGPTAACAVTAVAANVALSYALARYCLSGYIRHWIGRLGYTLPVVDPRAAWHSVLVVRLAPGLPFWVQSYALAILGIPWLPYLVLSTVIPSCYLCGVILMGEAAWQGRPQNILLGLAVFGLAAGAAGWWRRRSLRRPAA